jgi:hypothetical protein
MEFRLTYEGLLLGSNSKGNTRADHKHEIRKVFHGQLKRLWEITAHLKIPVVEKGHAGVVRALSRSQMLADQYTRCGYQFVPLVTEELSLLCSIEILFLRPDPPGTLIRSGDIDNRIKTLLDALRLPGSQQELGKYKTPEPGELPFFCLLEDDKLVTRISVETDMLLEPIGENIDDNDARLIITVRLRPYDMNWDNINFS